MPFFSDQQPIGQRNTIAALQVRNRLKKTTNLLNYLGKKVSSCPSFPASMTVEAALGLSLFVFAMVCLILPMKVMDTHRKMQAALEAVCEKATQYAYVKRQMEQGKDGKLDLESAGGTWTGLAGNEVGKSMVEGSECGEAKGGWAGEYRQYFLEGAVEAYASSRLAEYARDQPVEGISMERSQVLADGEDIDLVADYQVRLPFPVLRVSCIRQSVRSCRRAWIGKEGGLGSGAENRDREEEMVYVGKGSTRYHKDRNCHYLSNHLKAVPFDRLEEYRNQGGSRYKRCSSCGSSAASGSTVYIMASGERYHSDPDCRSIVAYVQVVPLEEAEHLGACSYCSQ